MRKAAFLIAISLVLCSFAFQLTVSPPPSGPTLTVNGSTMPPAVSSGSSLTVAATVGPGRAGDYMAICATSGWCPPFTGTNDYSYLNCTKTRGSAPYPTSGTCTLTAPSTAGSWTVEFLNDDGVTVYARVPLTTQGGGTVASVTGLTVNPNSCTIVSPATTCNFSGTLTAVCTPSPCPGTATFSLLAAATPTITVNGSSTGTTVSASASVTVAVANGPGNPRDWIGLCTDTTTCNTYSDWDYINGCTKTPPSTGVTSATCTVTAFSNSGSFFADFFPNDQHSGLLASAPFTVTGGGGGGGGPVQPFNNIACPRGCTWTNVFNADFTTMSPTGMFDNTTARTNALFYVPPDGSSNGSSPPSSTFACGQGGLDTSNMPGHLSLHALGTIPWEVAGALTCGIFPKSNNTQGDDIGCTNGNFSSACTPIPGPAIWEYKTQLAPNQIDEVSVGAGNGYGAGQCAILLYDYESRGNGSWNSGGPHVWSWQGCEPINAGIYQSLSDRPHVLDLLIDPQAGYTWFEDGVQVYSSNVGNCPSGTCAGRYPFWYEFNSAISNCWQPAPGCGLPAGGNWDIYWIREFRGY